jgi:hypothetical protein
VNDTQAALRLNDEEIPMNFKKAALLLALIIPALPVVTHAAARQDHSVVYATKHHSAAGFLIRVVTLGRKG